ncbi:helix-turn-helix transcriptional regulator [Bdellovibrio svalbardensis]|uniref:Helix-turn-helix transcriptional regulator n=1 Tax=Bdellovibrio svalbardensis TaxID=2972972 RepID=A0ABT6DRK3_9BACT|nr:helix-turn-helix transcriptional regulator [Bdellovibrio svalbardensis]MDG0817788.1 helix-turn-helix transcriptional regulator [Bdellovibrio svalbardensis]
MKCSNACILSQGLQPYIQDQFKQWGLTKTEGEIGLLLLKGLSLREISTIRGTSETTVRQQALVLYKKSSVEGRHQFAALFLEDLLSPCQYFQTTQKVPGT